MARKKDRTKREQEAQSLDSSQGSSTSGEQLDLIDVGPENLKEILPVARAYKKIVAARVPLTRQEVELKTKIRSFVHGSGLKPQPDGTFKFRCDGITIKIKPQEEKVTVTIDEDDDGEEE